MAQPPNNRPNGERPNGAQDPNFNWRGLILFAIAITLIGGALLMRGSGVGGSTEVSYPVFMEMMKRGELIIDRPAEYPVELISTTSSANEVLKAFKKAPAGSNEAPKRVHTQVNLMFLQENLYKQLDEAGVKPVQREDSNLMAVALISFLPIILFLLLLYFLFRQQIRMAGKGALNFG